MIAAAVVLAALAGRAGAVASFGNAPLNDASLTKARKNGVLLLAFGAGKEWRSDMSAVRKTLPGVPLEAVENPGDRIAIQRALERLQGQHAAKIVAIPLDPVTESPLMDQTRFLFGVRENPVSDRPEKANSGMPALKTGIKTQLVLPAAGGGGTASGAQGKRLESRAELVLAPSIDKSPKLALILADRAKALSRRPAQDALVLAGMAPRSQKGLEQWKSSAAAIAKEAAAKAGFREGALIWVRDGVPYSLRDQDAKENRAALRALVTKGGVVVVPLALDGGRIGQLLKRDAPGLAYRWDGKALAGDVRLTEWIRETAESAAKLPDSRQFKDGAPRARGGLR